MSGASPYIPPCGRFFYAEIPSVRIGGTGLCVIHGTVTGPPPEFVIPQCRAAPDPRLAAQQRGSAGPGLIVLQVWACPSFDEPRVAPRGDARNPGRVINDLEIVAPRPAFPLKARRLLNSSAPRSPRRDRCASMTSTSGLVLTSITVQFDLSTNITADAGYVDQAIQAASALLPEISPLPLRTRSPTRRMRRFWIFAVHSGGNPIQELDQYANILIGITLPVLIVATFAGM